MKTKLLLAQITFLSTMLGNFHVAHAADKSTTHTVVIEGMKFIPEALLVKSGDTVIWVNKDFFPHTATDDKKEFNSGEIKSNFSWKYKAAKKGSFSYVCTLHPTMKGSLTVK